MELYLKNWYDKFLDELKRTKMLRVSSPFIKEQIIRKMQNQFDFKNFELITRFNLCDFASNVSSLDGLKFSVECGANIFGVRDLHSKIYLFDKRSAIITSANLTSGGMINNYECGIYITDKSTIQKIHNYFDELKGMAGQKLSLEQCRDWQKELSQVEISNTSFPSLPDYGSSAIAIDKNRKYYVKFIGTGYNREPLSFSTKEVVDKALCHYACGFSKNKKPRQIQDGDIIYMARMTINPNDYAIFGKAEAIKFVDGRDEATPQEIQERPWKKDWPIYLRVKNPIFINGTLNDCVFLYDLIKRFDYESFPSTRSRYINGERDINPYNSLSQQPYVKLTAEAVEWLEPRFQEALNRSGKVNKRFIDNLPKSQINIESLVD